MSLIRKNGDLFPALPSLFNDFISRDVWNNSLRNHSNTNTTIPAVNITENNENFQVEMAAPGMTKEDFQIQLDGTTLTISCEKEDQKQEGNEKQFIFREFSYESFQRTFHLPKDVVDAESIQASYNNGVLRLTIPKKEEAKQRPPRQIKIS